MRLFVQQLVNGIGVGSQYALWAVGYGMVYQVLGLMHFAHGDTLVFAAFVAATLVAAGVSFWIAAAVSILVAATLAMAVERVVYRPLVQRNEFFLAFVGALGAAFVIRNALTYFWGNSTRVFPHDLVPRGAFEVWGVRISSLPLLNLVCALLAVVAFQRFLAATRTGQAIVAVAQDRETAALMGIPVQRVVSVVYGLSGAIGMLGVLLYIASFNSVNVGLGFVITLKAFIAAIIGGIGSVRGAVAGGMLLGVAEAMIGAYLTTMLVDGVLFVLLAFLLVFRPHGLIGQKEMVKL